MNQEVKKKWVDALRGGAYKQGKGFLFTDEGNDCHYCCLGVLCALYLHDEKPSETVSWQKREDPSGGLERVVGVLMGSEYVLPDAVAKWAGLNDVSPYVHINGRTEMLAAFNDQFNASFDQLSDAIEAQL